SSTCSGTGTPASSSTCNVCLAYPDAEPGSSSVMADSDSFATATVPAACGPPVTPATAICAKLSGVTVFRATVMPAPRAIPPIPAATSTTVCAACSGVGSGGIAGRPGRPGSPGSPGSPGIAGGTGAGGRASPAGGPCTLDSIDSVAVAAVEVASLGVDDEVVDSAEELAVVVLVEVSASAEAAWTRLLSTGVCAPPSGRVENPRPP